jgi:hypothetical protein
LSLFSIVIIFLTAVRAFRRLKFTTGALCLNHLVLAVERIADGVLHR